MILTTVLLDALLMRQWSGCMLCRLGLKLCWYWQCHVHRPHFTPNAWSRLSQAVRPNTSSHNVYSCFNLHAQGSDSDWETVFSRLGWTCVLPDGNPYRKRISSEKPFTWNSSESIQCKFPMTTLPVAIIYKLSTQSSRFIHILALGVSLLRSK